MSKNWVRRTLSRTGLLIGLLLILTNAGGLTAFAQRDMPEIWTAPVNLSQSGGTSNPFMFIDSEGVYHALWEDEYAGFVYRTGDGVSWEAPAVISVPFSSTEQKLVIKATQTDRLVAFWIDTQSNLFSSSIRLSSIKNASAWSRPIYWSSEVRDFDFLEDITGVLHLAYLRDEADDGKPAGIYSAHSLANELTWNLPTLVHTNPYLRGSTLADAHVAVSQAIVGDSVIHYIAWDNRSRRNLWLARSDDGGGNWGEPIELVKPTVDFGFDVPYDIQLSSSGEQVVALWKLGVPGEASCSVYSFVSNNRGQTWGAVEDLFATQLGCPESYRLIATGDREYLLFAKFDRQFYLAARDKLGWSTPQLQEEISNLFDLDAQRPFRLFDMSVEFYGDTLYLFGNTLPEEGGDVWLMSRRLDDRAAWFQTDVSWSLPETIDTEAGQIPSAMVVADSKGNLHAFWNVITGSGTSLRSDIFYSVWLGNNWSLPARILGPVRTYAFLDSVAINSSDTLFVTWERWDNLGNPEGLIVSWADSAEASSQAVWISSDPLPTLYPSATSATMSIDQDDGMRINFVLPLNEDRGVYTLTSSDNGRTWSQPTLVVDAISQGWGMVGNPQFASSADGKEIYAVWTVYTLPPNSRPVGLYTASSYDFGATWTSPEAVTEGWIEWSKVIQSKDGTFHRFWLINDQQILNLWHQTSADDGRTWGTPNNLLITTTVPALTAHADDMGRLHLVRISAEAGATPVLYHWIWLNGKWESYTYRQLVSEQSFETTILTSALTLNNVFGVAYVTFPVDSDDSNRTASLYFTRRVVETPPPSPTLPVGPTALVTAVPTITPTLVPPTLEPTRAQPTPTLEQSSAQPGLAGNPWFGTILTLTALVVVGIVVFAVRWYLQNKK